MRFGINLRGDLAKLNDTEIAAEFERLLTERQRVSASISWLDDLSWRWSTFPWTWFGRGPFRARIFYKLSTLYGYGTWPDALHLLDCEIKDVRDEIQRRVDARRASSETSR